MWACFRPHTKQPAKHLGWEFSCLLHVWDHNARFLLDVLPVQFIALEGWLNGCPEHRTSAVCTARRRNPPHSFPKAIRKRPTQKHHARPKFADLLGEVLVLVSKKLGELWTFPTTSFVC